MSKNHPFYWYHGFPVFDTAHAFVYLEDLKTRDNEDETTVTHMRDLYSAAASKASAVAASLASNAEVSKNALDFLLTVADNERNKELQVIKDYKDQLADLFPKDPHINKILSQFNSSLIENPDQVQEFYLYLTKYINTIRQGAEDYTNRLNSFLVHNNKKMNELQQDDYRFRGLSDLEGTFNNLIGTATRAQEKAQTQYLPKIRDAALQFILQSNLINQIQSGADFAALFSVIQLDLEKKCQDMLYKLNKADLTDLAIDGELDTIINEYLNASGEQDTKLQKVIQANNDELVRILDSAKNILGIKQIKDSSEQAKRQLQSIARTNLLSPEISLRKKIQASSKNLKWLLDELQLLQFSITTQQNAHGNLFELIQIVQEGNTIKVKGNTGTDIINLGSFDFNLTPTNIQSQFREKLQNIEHALTDFETQKRKGRFDHRTRATKAMNDAVNSQIKEMNNLLKTQKNLDIQNLFVYHESLKLYKSAETNESKGFHGRDMLILNYIDDMYSANNLAKLELPDRNTLYFLALNLGAGAVAADKKDDLVNYLSIFAGLLMFDDIYNMAKEAQASLLMGHYRSPGKVKQIHLYNLNGVYVPSSMILTSMYMIMSELNEQAFEGTAAKAQISTSGANQAISNYLGVRPKPLYRQWAPLADAASSGTNIRIQLLSGFTSLVTQLSEI